MIHKRSCLKRHAEPKRNSVFCNVIASSAHPHIRTSTQPVLFLPLTSCGPAAEVWWWLWCHGCSTPSGCFSSPWWLGLGPWCSPSARYRPHTGGRRRAPLTGWSAARCKIHLGRGREMGGWAMRGTGATDGSSSSAASLIQTLPGKMLDGFLSMFLLLSSPPFFGISVSMDSQLVCKKTQNRMKCFTDTSFLSWEELQNDSLKHSGCGVARIWEQFKRAEEARSAFDFLTI